MSEKAVVLALVTAAFGGRGGVAAVSRDVVRALAKLDDVGEVKIYPWLVSEDMEPTPPKVDQRRAAPNKFSYVASALRAARAQRPRLIYCDHLHLAPAAALAARVARAPLIVQIHGNEIWSKPSPVRRQALEAADLLLCVSRDTRRQVLSLLKIPPERAVVLNNTFHVDPGTQSHALPSFPLLHAQGHPILLTVGRLNALERYKGHEHVFEVVAMLLSRGVEVRHIVAGDGDDRIRLEKIVQERGLANQVRFLGQVPRAELVRLYQEASVFVMPSSGEGFGIAFVEAMALGTPAVGLGERGATDALADGIMGIATTIDELPNAVIRAIQLSKEDREAGAARTSARFGVARFDLAMAGFWRRLVYPTQTGHTNAL